jgi:hypothetical protein
MKRGLRFDDLLRTFETLQPYQVLFDVFHLFPIPNHILIMASTPAKAEDQPDTLPDLVVFGEVSEFGSVLEMMDQCEREVHSSIRKTLRDENSVLRQRIVVRQAHWINTTKLLRKVLKAMVELNNLLKEFDGLDAKVKGEWEPTLSNPWEYDIDLKAQSRLEQGVA